MTDPYKELLKDLKALIRYYIRCGSQEKLKHNPQTNQVSPSSEGGDIPAELFTILQQMLGGENKLPPELAEMFRQFEAGLRAWEDNLTPEQRQQLQDFSKELQNATTHRQLKEAEEKAETLDPAVQEALEGQRRLRQSLATRIYEAWKDFNQEQDEEEGEGEDDNPEDGEGDDDPYSDMSDPSESSGDDDTEDGNGDGDGESDSQDGESGQDGQPSESGEDGQGQGDPFNDDNPRPEDFEKGLQKWLKELEEQTQQEEQQAQAEAEALAEAEEGQEGEGEDGDGDDGQQQLPFPQGAQKGEPAFELSQRQVDPYHLRIVKQAFDKLLSRGRDNPKALPRWNTRKLVQRILTGRPLRPARQPTLERKAVMFIIDNSTSMSALENAARAFAAALSGASGPGGADIIVATSFNGNFVNEDANRQPQAECWFLNGKYQGFLPVPPASSGYDKKYHGQCWEWFIRRELRRRGVDVRTVGIYGDNNGGHIWCYMSNRLKGIPFIWFNPSDQAGINTKGPVVVEKNPYIADRKNLTPAKGHGKGDPRYEKFLGISCLRIKTADDIVMTLRRHVRN